MNLKSDVKFIKSSSYKKFYRNVAKFLIIFIIFLTLPNKCLSHSDLHDVHDHDHDHHDEPPSFKYSKEANENFIKQKEAQKHHHHHGHDHGHDHDTHIPHHHNHNSHVKRSLDMSSIWLHSIGSTLLISAAPFLILYIIPLDNTEKMQPRLKILLAFASGGLLGDAFLHLIPHAIIPHSHHDHGHEGEHDHEHSHSDHDHGHGHDMSVGLFVLAGIITFLAVEKGVRLLKGETHSHGHESSKLTKKIEKDTSQTNKSNEHKDKDHKHQNNKVSEVKKKKDKPAKEESNVSVAGYLNLAADFTHNFTDGLAIGASYLAGNSIGIVTTITILLHEVPHEIGDFAILIKSGCSRRKAMMLQLVTAIGALAGTALALLGAGHEAANLWVLPFTAGGFIYIATVSVLPELLEESTKLGQSLKEISSLLAGVGLMILIANFE